MSNLRLSYLQKVGGGGYLYRPSPHPKKWGIYPPSPPPPPPGIYASGPRHKECALIKLIGLLLTTMASRNDITSALVYIKLKRKIFGPRHCLTKCALYRKQISEPKWLILVSFFSGEVTSYTDSSYSIHILWEVSVQFFLGHPIGVGGGRAGGGGGHCAPQIF